MFILFTHFAFSEHFRSFVDQDPFWTHLAGQCMGMGVQTVVNLEMLFFVYVKSCMLTSVYAYILLPTVSSALFY